MPNLAISKIVLGIISHKEMDITIKKDVEILVEAPGIPLPPFFVPTDVEITTDLSCLVFCERSVKDHENIYIYIFPSFVRNKE